MRLVQRSKRSHSLAAARSAIAVIGIALGHAEVALAQSSAPAEPRPIEEAITPVSDPEVAPAPDVPPPESAPAPEAQSAPVEAAPIMPAAAPAVVATPAASTPPSVPWGFELAGIEWRPSLEARARGELRTGAYVGEADQGIVTFRARIGMDARWELLRAFVQVQDARDFGVTPGAQSGGSTGIHQGFFEIGDGSSYARAGRQEIDYGSGRLIGSLNWASAARSFDALRVHTQQGEFSLDGFGAVVRTPRTLNWPDGTPRSSEGDYAGGIAAEWSPGEALRLGGYALYRHDGPTEAPAGTDMMAAGQWLDRHRDIGAFSLRASGNVERRLRYEVELVLEAGRVGDDDFLAAGMIGEAHYKLDAPWSPEIGVGGSFGTGESADGTWNEFDNFFPTNHLIYGLLDLFGLRNQTHGFARFGLTPIDRQLSVWAAGRVYRFVEPGARWTNAGGAVVGRNPMNTDEFAGVEVDVEARWTPIDHLAIWGGYGAFIPGGGAASLGHPDPMHWGYLMVGVLVP